MNTLLLKLTQLCLHATGDKYVRLDIIKLPEGKEQEVIVYSNAKSPYLGQLTIFETTLVNVVAFRNERLRNYQL